MNRVVEIPAGDIFNRPEVKACEENGEDECYDCIANQEEPEIRNINCIIIVKE